MAEKRGIRVFFYNNINKIFGVRNQTFVFLDFIAMVEE